MLQHEVPDHDVHRRRLDRPGARDVVLDESHVGRAHAPSRDVEHPGGEVERHELACVRGQPSEFFPVPQPSSRTFEPATCSGDRLTTRASRSRVALWSSSYRRDQRSYACATSDPSSARAQSRLLRHSGTIFVMQHRRLLVVLVLAASLASCRRAPVLQPAPPPSAGEPRGARDLPRAHRIHVRALHRAADRRR